MRRIADDDVDDFVAGEIDRADVGAGSKRFHRRARCQTIAHRRPHNVGAAAHCLDDPVSGAIDDEGVVSQSAGHQIDSGVAIQNVVPGLAVEHVAAASSAKHISAAAAEQDVCAGIADEVVSAGAAECVLEFRDAVFHDEANEN